jgi:ABC-type nickel/cobalt efflux system permease component RcnA
MITAGQNPPAFQSSYPFSFSANAQPSLFTSPHASHTNGSHQHQHQHHHHYAASPSHLSANASFMLTAHDLTSIWLADLDLGASWPSPSPSSLFASVSNSSSAQRQRAFSNADTTGLIKLEPSPIDIELSRPQPQPHTSAVFDIDGSSSSSDTRSAYPSRAPSPLKRNPFPPRADLHPPSQQRRSPVQLLLPALSIYYPLPTIPPPGSSAASSAAFPRHVPSTSASTPSSVSTTSPAVGASANTGHALPSPQPQYARPQVTPALVALLPPLQTCRRLLARAREVLRVRPIPFEPGGAVSAQAQASAHARDPGWHAFERRCLAVLGGGPSKERERERERKEREKEKAREARRARQIYFGGIPGLQQQETDMDVDGEGAGSGGGRGSKTSRPGGENAGGNDDATGEDQPLTFFALMCAILAMGASVPSPPPSAASSSPSPNSNTSPVSPRATAETPAFLYALSQQALGVWDTHHTALAAGHAHAHAHAHAHPPPPTAMAEEAEKMDYLLACIAGLGYLLLTSAPGRNVGLGSGTGDDEGLSERDGGSRLGLGLGSGLGLGLGLGLGAGAGFASGPGAGAALIYALVRLAFFWRRRRRGRCLVEVVRMRAD